MLIGPCSDQKPKSLFLSKKRDPNLRFLGHRKTLSAPVPIPIPKTEAETDEPIFSVPVPIFFNWLDRRHRKNMIMVRTHNL